MEEPALSLSKGPAFRLRCQPSRTSFLLVRPSESGDTPTGFTLAERHRDHADVGYRLARFVERQSNGSHEVRIARLNINLTRLSHGDLPIADAGFRRHSFIVFEPPGTRRWTLPYVWRKVVNYNGILRTDRIARLCVFALKLVAH